MIAPDALFALTKILVDIFSPSFSRDLDGFIISFFLFDVCIFKHLLYYENKSKLFVSVNWFSFIVN